MIPGVACDIGACFSPDYATSRQRFLEDAAKAGGRVQSYANRLEGPLGETLAADAAWFGPDDAGAVLVLVSATHGVEGFSGAAAQLDWLLMEGPRLLPPGAAALLVHAINPWGFAWLRRTTEEGVDLNRNCVDFSAGAPDNPGYRELAQAFVPRAIDAVSLRAADERLDAYRAEHGDRAYQAARSSGQHSHPEGVFYGGLAPTWSLGVLGAICADFRLSAREGVAIIDFHTGLGPFGYGEPICGHRPGTSGQARCRAWYGESLGEPLLGKSSSLPIAGLTQYAWARHIGDEVLTFIALEFGTYLQAVGEIALREEHWLHAYGEVDWTGGETRRIKSALRNFYGPDAQDWREMMLLRSRQVIGQASAGLAAMATNTKEIA